MIYNGVEIDMLDVGDADCIIVTHWSNGVATRVLIDGGNLGAADTIERFCKRRGITEFDHLVCSHPHGDHANGLIELIESGNLKIGNGWLHLPFQHYDFEVLTKSLTSQSGGLLHKNLFEAFSLNLELAKKLMKAGVVVREPFAGQRIGPLSVLGPTVEFYVEALDNIAQQELLEKCASIFEALEKSQVSGVEELVVDGNPKIASSVIDEASDPNPIHRCCTVLELNYDGKLHLFTSDAEETALLDVMKRTSLSNLHWMQIPHHGSRRNVNTALISHFAPKTAFVSADGNKKHPRRAVVSAFKRVGTKVYSTHYPNGSPKWHHCGQVPERSDYSSAIPLWDSE